MQTFVPLASYTKSAQVLDRMRLGKQRVETLQILKSIHYPQYGWKNHPAVKMWVHCPVGLIQYGLAVCAHWKLLGYNDTCHAKILSIANQFYPGVDLRSIRYPRWWRGKIHATHRSKLMQKLPEYYTQFGWNTPDNLEYFWPV